MTARALPLAVLMLSSLVTSPIRAQDRAALNPLATLDKATLKAFVELPLFEPSRHRPVVVPPPVNVPPPPMPVVEQPPSLRLLGLVEGAHSLAAIVHRNDTGKTETLRPGDRIGSWVVELMPATLRVLNGDRAFDYALFRGGASQGPTAVAPPPAFVAPTVVARDPALKGSR